MCNQYIPWNHKKMGNHLCCEYSAILTTETYQGPILGFGHNVWLMYKDILLGRWIIARWSDKAVTLSVWKPFYGALDRHSRRLGYTRWVLVLEEWKTWFVLVEVGYFGSSASYFEVLFLSSNDPVSIGANQENPARKRTVVQKCVVLRTGSTGNQESYRLQYVRNTEYLLRCTVRRYCTVPVLYGYVR